METIDTAQVISLLVGFVVPLLVGLLSKWDASKTVKSILNFGLSALSSVLATVIPDQFEWGPFLFTFAMTWATSIATYYGLWKPTNAATKVQSTTATFGVGNSNKKAAA